MVVRGNFLLLASCLRRRLSSRSTPSRPSASPRDYRADPGVHVHVYQWGIVYRSYTITLI